MEPLRLEPPLSAEVTRRLTAGMRVEFTGTLYTARDAAHKRMIEALDRGDALPVDLEGAIIYYVGPTPGAPGQVVGSAGPTTASRMDSYAPRLFELGVRGTIGKGHRSAQVIEAMTRWGAVYFMATGGAGALLGRRIVSAEVVAYDDLGPEALRRLHVERFPAIVAIDSTGRSLLNKGSGMPKR